MLNEQNRETKKSVRENFPRMSVKSTTKFDSLRWLRVLSISSAASTLATLCSDLVPKKTKRKLNRDHASAREQVRVTATNSKRSGVVQFCSNEFTLQRDNVTELQWLFLLIFRLESHLDGPTWLWRRRWRSHVDNPICRGRCKIAGRNCYCVERSFLPTSNIISLLLLGGMLRSNRTCQNRSEKVKKKLSREIEMDCLLMLPPNCWVIFSSPISLSPRVFFHFSTFLHSLRVRRYRLHWWPVATIHTNEALDCFKIIADKPQQ